MRIVVASLGVVLQGAVRDQRTGARVWAPGGVTASRALVERCDEERLFAATASLRDFRARRRRATTRR